MLTCLALLLALAVATAIPAAAQTVLRSHARQL